MKRISGIVLHVEISIDALIACCLWWDGYLKVDHCGSHGPRLSCKREIGNPHDTYALAMRNIIDEDIKTFGRVPRKISAGTGYARFNFQ